MFQIPTTPCDFVQLVIRANLLGLEWQRQMAARSLAMMTMWQPLSASAPTKVPGVAPAAPPPAARAPRRKPATA